MTLAELRQHFPALHQQVNEYPLVYLDNAATTHKPQSVIQAIHDYYAQVNANTHSLHHLASQLTEQVEQARTALQDFLGVQSGQGQIAFTKSTTEAINIVAQSLAAPSYSQTTDSATHSPLQLQPGDTIALSVLEHHANVVPWQRVAAHTGAELSWIGLDSQQQALDRSQLDKVLASRPKILAITAASNVLGLAPHLSQIISQAHQAGTYVLIDAAQAVAHGYCHSFWNSEANTITNLNPDFLVVSAHKMLGPTGIGALYVKQDLLPYLEPLVVGGDMIHEVHFTHSEFSSDISKLEGGTQNFAGILGWQAAMDYWRWLATQTIHIPERLPTDYLPASAKAMSATNENNFTDLSYKNDIHSTDYTCTPLAWEKILEKYARRRLSQVPQVRLLSPDDESSVPVLSFVVPTLNSLDLASFLNLQGVAIRVGKHCAHPLHQTLGVESSIRLSLSFYNSVEDIDQLVYALERGIEILE